MAVKNKKVLQVFKIKNLKIFYLKIFEDLKSMIKNTFPNIDRINQTLINTLEEFERYRQSTLKNLFTSI